MPFFLSGWGCVEPHINNAFCLLSLTKLSRLTRDSFLCINKLKRPANQHQRATAWKTSRTSSENGTSPFRLKNVLQLSRNWIGIRSLEIKRKIGNFVVKRSRRPHNCKSCHFTWLTRRERLRKAQKMKNARTNCAKSAPFTKRVCHEFNKFFNVFSSLWTRDFPATNCKANDFPTDYVPHHVADWTFLTWFNCQEKKAKVSWQEKARAREINRQYSFNVKGSQSIAYIGDKSTRKETTISFQEHTIPLTEATCPVLPRLGITASPVILTNEQTISRVSRPLVWAIFLTLLNYLN